MHKTVLAWFDGRPRQCRRGRLRSQAQSTQIRWLIRTLLAKGYKPVIHNESMGPGIADILSALTVLTIKQKVEKRAQREVSLSDGTGAQSFIELLYVAVCYL
jgi:hypothetical protein